VGIFSEFLPNFGKQINRSGNKMTRYWAEKKGRGGVLGLLERSGWEMGKMVEVRGVCGWVGVGVCGWVGVVVREWRWGCFWGVGVEG
jgi:hypothetical protein